MIMKPFIPILALLITSCNSKSSRTDTKIVSFQFPAIIQQTKIDSLEAWQTNGISEVFPKFIGQYKFSDTVYLQEQMQSRRISEEQYKWECQAFDFDTLSSDGLQIYTDYQKTIESGLYYGARKFHQFFPVYVVNETQIPKLFIAKDSYVFAIQEAVDTGDFMSWHAIEAKGFDFCGDGYFRRKVLPHEFIMFLMPKYSGNDTTFLRTRIKIGDKILLSKPYRGTISNNQFKVQKAGWVSDVLKKKDPATQNFIFYGATNKE